MTSKEALEEIKDWVEYFTRLDYVEPIVRGEVQQQFKKAYWGSLKHFENIEKDLEVLTILHDKEVALECVKATDNYKDYIRAVQRIYGNVNIDITEQEYNLLKGWLKYDK